MQAGEVYGILTVLEQDMSFVDNNRRSHKKWIVRCNECGTTRSMRPQSIKKYKSGCMCDTIGKPYKKDLTGEWYGDIVVTGYDMSRYEVDQKGYWLARCNKCGNEMSMTVASLEGMRDRNNRGCPECRKRYNEYTVIDAGKTIIHLSTGGECLISTCDLELVRPYLWLRDSRGYIMTSKGRANTVTHLYIHQLLMGIPPEGYTIDHINGDTHNNMRSNLRIITIEQNAQNINTPPRSNTGYRGIHENSRGKFEITVSGKYMGICDNIEDAIAARQIIINEENNNGALYSTQHDPRLLNVLKERGIYSSIPMWRNN